MKKNLLLVAHPDDESIFFSGLLLRQKNVHWHLICVTDGNADGRGKIRTKEFFKAAKILGVKRAEQWHFPDFFEKRLDINKLKEKIKELGEFDSVFTHGPIGEYGHPHHQDLAYAASQVFKKHPRFYGTAYNCAHDLAIELTHKEFTIKTKLFSKIYKEETKRFMHLLPALSVEFFAKFDSNEVAAVYKFLTEGKKTLPKKLKKYTWMRATLNDFSVATTKRPF